MKNYTHIDLEKAFDKLKKEEWENTWRKGELIKIWWHLKNDECMYVYSELREENTGSAIYDETVSIEKDKI